MRQIFRFFRGELNGFFVNAVCVFLNLHLRLTGFLDELAYALTAQWFPRPDEDASEQENIDILARRFLHLPNASPMRLRDIYDIGMIGGLFQPRTFARSSMGSVWFADSARFVNGERQNIIGDPDRNTLGTQRSERGLVGVEEEYFVFVRTGQDNYPTDIAVESSENYRRTLIEHGAEPIGYVREGTPLFTEQGEVITANVLAEPPSDAAYIEWFGMSALHLEEFFESDNLPLTVDVFMPLFEAMQRVRRNGASIASLLDITEILGQHYIKDLEIRQAGNIFTCLYSLDGTAEVFNRERRYAAWLNVTAMKFKEFVFVDRGSAEGVVHG